MCRKPHDSLTTSINELMVVAGQKRGGRREDHAGTFDAQYFASSVLDF
jgi:hypothetical protein